MNRPIKELIFDIEVSGMLMFGFGVGKQNVSYLQLLTECKIVCLCYRWRDEPIDIYHELKWNHKKQCDKKLLLDFIKVVEQADVVIGQNHERFDIRHVNARIASHGLAKQLPILVTDDLYKLVKRKLYLPCYKLDYMAEHFGFGRKKQTDLQLWIDLLYHRKKEALDYMTEYCGRDVILTDQVFTRLEPYLNRKILGSVWNDDRAHCRQINCDGKLVSRGHRICSNLQKRTQYACNKCGKYVTLGYNELRNTKEYTR